MHVRTCISLFAIGLLASFMMLSGQNYTFSNPEKLNNKVRGYDILGITEEGILIRKYGEFYESYQSLDRESLNVKWNRELTIEDRKTSIEESIISGDKVLILYKHKDKSQYRYYIQQYNQMMVPVGDEIELLNFEKKLTSYGFEIELIQSLDRKHFALLKKNKSGSGFQSLEYVCFDHTFQNIQQQSLTLENNTAYHDAIVGTNGFMYISFIDKNKLFGNSNDAANKIRLYAYNAKKDQSFIKNVSLDKFFALDFAIEFDHINQQLIIAGYYSEKKTKASMGYLFSRINMLNADSVTLHYNRFDQGTLKRIEKDNLFSAADEINDLENRKIIPRSDGGILILGEIREIGQRNSGFNNPTFNTFENRTREILTYSFGEIIVASINPNGELNWSRVLDKKQYTENDDAYYSSFGIGTTKNQIHLLFNESINKYSNFNEYLISKTGQYKVNSIFNAKEKNLVLAPRYAKQISANEILVPSFNERNQFILAKIQY